MREPKAKESKAEEPKKKRPAKDASVEETAAEAVVTAEPAAPAKKRVRVRKAEGEKTSSDRSQRKLRQGMVVSNKMQKTVVVEIARRVQHPLYGKVVIRSNKFKAHDELSCDVGDRVEIMETRALSKEKRWRVTQILEKVK